VTMLALTLAPAAAHERTKPNNKQTTLALL
jgi:hypothetical protein